MSSLLFNHAAHRGRLKITRSVDAAGEAGVGAMSLRTPGDKARAVWEFGEFHLLLSISACETDCQGKDHSQL
jgi:hypothetical protein